MIVLGKLNFHCIKDFLKYHCVTACITSSLPILSGRQTPPHRTPGWTNHGSWSRWILQVRSLTLSSSVLECWRREVILSYFKVSWQRYASTWLQLHLFVFALASWTWKPVAARSVCTRVLMGGWGSVGKWIIEVGNHIIVPLDENPRSFAKIQPGATRRTKEPGKAEDDCLKATFK